ncbi:MAG: signal peptide peptidase SppA [Firmicutes bacterium]|nr:signal peptide peptidase SppA [Bacillota bacterium]
MKQYSEEGKQRTAVFPEKPKKKQKRGLWIFFGIVVVLGLFALLMDMGGREDGGPVQGEPYVAVMYVEGEISDSNYDSLGYPYDYQHYWTLDQLAELAHDPDNRGIFFYVDSPGGTIYHSDELYLAVKAYQSETGRPVCVYMGPYGASGAYYFSAAADRIYVNRNTLTGSIGVTMGTYFDFSDALEKLGIKTHTVDTGEMKNTGNGMGEITESQKEYLQSLVDEAYEQFVDIIAEEREIPLEDVKALADGRLYTAKQALELGLIDEIGPLEDSILSMRRDFGLWDCEFIDVAYEYDSSLGVFDLLYYLTGKAAPQEARAQARSQSEISFPMNYLYTVMDQE